MGQVAMACEQQQDDVNRGSVGRHAAYWSKVECIRKELSGSVRPLSNAELCDRLGINGNYAYDILSKMRSSLNNR